jgi:hypothetical protein
MECVASGRQIKTPSGNPRAKVGKLWTRYRGRFLYFFFLLAVFLAVFFAPPPFLVAFFIDRFSLT